MNASPTSNQIIASARIRQPLFDTPDFYKWKLERELGGAVRQALTFSDLMVRLSTIWSESESQLVQQRIEDFVPLADRQPYGDSRVSTQRMLTVSQQDELTRVLTELIGKADTLPDRDRACVDRVVGRLSHLLTSDRAWSVVAPWFGDKRKSRRRVVIRVLTTHGVPSALACGVIEEYRATQERSLLKLISANPQVAALFEEDDLRLALTAPENDWQHGPYETREGTVGPFLHRDRDARFGKMLAIETFLIGGHVPADDIAFEYPMAFAWAVGRQAHQPSLPLLMRVLDRFRNDPELVWRSMRAIGRTGSTADIEHVRTIAMQLVNVSNDDQEHIESI